MKSKYIEYLILLEKTLAAFYENLKQEDEFASIRPVLEFMETHSAEHAERIEEMHEKNPRPAIDDNLILNVQNNISKKVKEYIKYERDRIKVLETLAKSEEEIGDMYKRFAEYLIKLSDWYKLISGEVLKLTDEEYNHRDILLNDRDQLKKKNK